MPAEQARFNLHDQVTEEERILREWLGAITNEITARRDNTDIEVIKFFATAALEGKAPHWYTDEYKARVYPDA